MNRKIGKDMDEKKIGTGSGDGSPVKKDQNL